MPTAEQTISVGAGQFDSILLTWKTGGQQSKVWIVDEFPFPIKAKTSVEGVDIDYPLSGTLNPLGTVLVGSHPDSTSTNKKAKLELIYSSY